MYLLFENLLYGAWDLINRDFWRKFELIESVMQVTVDVHQKECIRPNAALGRESLFSSLFLALFI